MKFGNLQRKLKRNQRSRDQYMREIISQDKRSDLPKDGARMS